MSGLTAVQRERMIGCLRLWQHPETTLPERDAAMAGALRILKARNLDWDELIAPPPHREPLMETWRTTCAELASQPDDLRPWERHFVANLPKFQRISAKQRYILKEIADRVLGRSASASPWDSPLPSSAPSAQG